MQLVADRFAVHKDGRAFDLATGARVTLIIGSAGGISEQLRWTERCDTLGRLRHQAMAPLLDYGLLGESSRFEAWGCGAAVRHCEDDDAVHAIATQWLRACGRSTGRRLADSVRFAGGDGEVWLPEPGTGYPNQEQDASAGVMPLGVRGLQIVERPVVSKIAEMFHPAGARPRVLAMWGAVGSGRRVIVAELARLARLNGFVPVAAPLIGSRQAELWSGRCLFVIADAADENVWQTFVHAALAEAQPHVLLIVGEHEYRSTGGVGVGRMATDALVSAIRPRVLDARLEQAARRAAESAHGLPGRFARLLWPAWDIGQRSVLTQPRSGVSRVAEQQAVYGRGEAAGDLFDPPPVTSAWPAPGELAAFRRKMEAAIGHIARGRHAHGIRQLRQAVGSLARRGAWSDAARGARELAGVLLRRGQARDALAAVGNGRDYANRADEAALLVDLAIVSGHAWIDLGRLDEADSVLGTALVAARTLQDPDRVAAVSIASARTSYWRGAYAEAAALLTPSPCSPALHVRRTLLASRLAVGTGDLGRAMSLLATVSAETIAGLDIGTKAAVAWATAFVHFAVRDLPAVEADLSHTLALARAAHDSQRAIRVRLLRAEVARAREGSTIALVRLERLRRVMTNAPMIVRARWDVATALSQPSVVAADVVAKHARGTGLGALGLYVTTGSSGASLGLEADGRLSASLDSASRSGQAAHPFVDDLVAILRMCQTAADETELLKEVCARLRQHLHAAAVAFVMMQAGHAHTLVSDGARLETEIAERAVSAGITISPHGGGDRIEAAAPIVYGGASIGALAARWTIGSLYDTSRAAPVLTMSAAAAAPMLAAVVARHAQGEAGPGELLGVTPVMAALRQSVARAAAAPFGVLVDGESGSGKELVARAIHRGSARRHKPFCTLNCAALPDDLVEAELFGHTRGAFTGAIAERPGVFEEAHGGTLFLDEIGELTPRAQAKVLRVIQDGELRRVGENVSRRVDVRIVSATNRALRQEVDAGRFRLDLLYRLDVVHITVPPLRDRREDVAVLADRFWRDATQRIGSRATLGAATVAALARYDWPGNVRELQNVLAALAVRTPTRGVVPPTALPPCFGASGLGESWSLDAARRTFELRFVRAALVRTGGHRGRAAAELGVTRQGLTKLMSRLGIKD